MGGPPGIPAEVHRYGNPLCTVGDPGEPYRWDRTAEREKASYPLHPASHREGTEDIARLVHQDTRLMEHLLEQKFGESGQRQAKDHR